jgi:hypothetical protein
MTERKFRVNRGAAHPKIINPGTEVAGFIKTPTDWAVAEGKQSNARLLLLFAGRLGLFLGRFFLGHGLLSKKFCATARLIFSFNAR